MKARRFTIAAVSCLVLALVAGLVAQETRAKTDNAARRWQHLALEQDAKRPLSDPEFAKRIDQLGNDGWELVAVDSVLDSSMTTKRIYFFKRPR
jgi:hypothetical protein